MSDSIKKWHEMQEEKEFEKKNSNTSSTSPGTFIYESPDGGETITRRPFGGDIEDREVIKEPQELTEEELKEAYKILAYYDSKVIRYAVKILDLENAK